MRTPSTQLKSTDRETNGFANWLPDMDSNHDKQIQRLLCYRYTIGQIDGGEKLVR